MTSIVWIKASALREKVAKLIEHPVEKLGDAQWIGHILKRLYLLDQTHRKREADGMVYGVNSVDVLDIMRRYDVSKIESST